MEVLRASRRFQAALHEADLGWRDEREPGIVWSVYTQCQGQDVAGLWIAIDITSAHYVDECEVGWLCRELHCVLRFIHDASSLVKNFHLEVF